MGRAGKLNINIDNVRLTSGEKVALRAIKAGRPKRSLGVVPARMRGS